MERQNRAHILLFLNIAENVTPPPPHIISLQIIPPLIKYDISKNSSKLLILAKKRLVILSNLSTKNHIRLC